MKIVTAIVLLLTTAMPSSAQVVDPLVMTTDPGDVAVMAEASLAVAGSKPDITRLNAVLAKLPRPTPLRGVVQTVRAWVLAAASDMGPAVTTVEEALRLLPDDPRPKLAATYIFTFSGSPQRAADLWMRASQESPDMARLSDRYLMTALVSRLTDIGDGVRADRVSARLGEIGFSAALAPERSSAALARTRDAALNPRGDDAQSLVTAIGDPNDLLSLYVDRKYKSLWPRIAEWAGTDLEPQSLRYLEELRADWTAADDFDTAAPYARRLASMEAYSAVVTLFLPMFDDDKWNNEQNGAEFLAPIVARSLARLGRVKEADDLLVKVAASMPVPDGGRGLNIDGTYVNLAATQTDWPQLLVRADTFLEHAKPIANIINQSAMIEVLAWRACALSRLGRSTDAQRAMATVVLAGSAAPNSVMSMYTCLGEVAAARTFIIARLADENTRTWALRFVQPVRNNMTTPLDRLINPIALEVRNAPDVLAAVNAVGRILPKPVSKTLPAGFDPFRAKPSHLGAGTDAI